MTVWQRHLRGDDVPRIGRSGFASVADAIARSWCAAAAVAIFAIVVLAIWSPRTALGGEPTPAMPVSQPGSRALRSIDPTPHDDALGIAEPDVWCVSTRRLPATCRVPLAPHLSVERFVEGADGQRGGRWHSASLASLLADDSGRPLVFFIHGNRYESAAAKQQGLLLARHCAASCPGAAPVRTVIFSWPSEQRGILLKDGRAKYERAFSEGRYMAWLLGQIEPSRPVGIVAYSYGALITLEGLKDLVAAEQSGRTDLQPWRDRPAKTNLVFIAPAVRCDALAPRGPYRETVECIDSLSLIINSSDDALRFFPLLDHRVGADALGYVGMPRRWLPGHVEFSAVDGAAIIGKNHGLPLYLASPSLTKRLCAAAASGM
jgi:hypothetical protein